MAEAAFDPSAYLDQYAAAPEEPVDITKGVKGRVYGPVVGEYHHDAMFGPKGNALTERGVALSPDLLKKYPLGTEIYSNNKGPYRVEDVSFVKPGHPNTNTVEFRDQKNPPERVNITPSPTPGAEIVDVTPETPSLSAAVQPMPAPRSHRVADVMLADLTTPEQPQAEPVPLPDPTPYTPPTSPDFSRALQQATFNPPPQSLIASTAQFDPTAYLAQIQTPTPSPTPQVEFDPGAYLSQRVSASELPQPPIGAEQPAWYSNALQAAKEVGVAMLPKSAADVGVMLGGPLAQLPQDVARHVGVVQDLVQGKPISAIEASRFPESEMIKEAEKTPAFSKERFKAGFHIAGRVGQAAALGSQLRAAALTPARAEVQPQPNVAAPVAVPEVSQITTSQFANRFTAQKVAGGELGPVQKGVGLSTKDLVERGTQMHPEEVTQHVSDVMNGVAQDPLAQAAAIRAEEARLSNVSARLSKVARANPADMEARIAAENAFNDVTDFHNGPVAVLKNNWANTGRLMQGEIEIDLSTLNGQREAWLKDVGSTPPAEALPTLQKLADQIKASQDKRHDVAQEWANRADALKPSITPEMVREQMLVKLKKLTPC